MCPLNDPIHPLLTYIPDVNTSISSKEENNPQIQKDVLEVFQKLNFSTVLSSPKTVIHINPTDSPTSNHQEVNTDASQSTIFTKPEIAKADSTFNSITPKTPKESLPAESLRCVTDFSPIGKRSIFDGRQITGNESVANSTFALTRDSKLDDKYANEDGIYTDAFFRPPGESDVEEE